ncbi:ubiquitin-specific protease, putative [Phytophthora infestans T30-4]|uniref:Ubiquitin-specific protease, putative n=2 Tax=Phytophthora infestans TaxID=4787 RepID=D0MSU1_PHYIT|nr:ubiquitin-specific protease, putative [Phytophthora infestans T30-4]EEY57525.1 ubiquitin-specific protease, putative [Phytophthora infestans T30-4]KAF4029659.1 Ubiquitin carboxyl-terminal hydrolase domain-containing protein [Phytophthora infestans]KAF4135378.1 Ubiquitin carboxyl-terminal hydrolase domain-containing protein [Phytophthora infestans]|eukprot:XP_002908711.1 ubiquitin-specific protease, putative [Phytophthora infestans T30-4]
MRSSSSSRGSLRRFFSHRRHRVPRGASARATPASGAAAQRSLAARTRLLDTWSLPELFALRELVHVAVNKTFIAPEVQLDPPALQRAVRGDDLMRTGASSSASSSTTATSSIEDLKRQQQLQTHVDSALVRSKRFYFSRRADTRLRLSTRRQFVRLFPLLGRASRTSQRTLFRAFDANDTGKIEFDELCEMLARVKQARGSSVGEMAELVFAWFQGDKSEAVLTHTDVKLLAMTAMELEGDSKVQTEHGYDLVASLMKLLLEREQHQVTKQVFCQRMDCELGTHVLHVLFAPFGVVKALLDEETILQEVDTTRWRAGDTAYVVSNSWWTQWRRYVQPDHCSHHSQHNQTRISNNQHEQEAGEQQEQQQERHAQPQVAVCHLRPGPIANSDICANEQLGTLRPGLIEDEDFVLVSSTVWKRLVQVYGGGPEFPRQITAVSLSDEQLEMPSREEDGKPIECTNVTLVLKSRGQLDQHVQVDLYPVVLQVRLARHDSRHVYLVYSRRFLMHRTSSIKEIVHRMGIIPDVNAREVTVWLRRRRLQSWARLECSLEAPHATLEGLQITSAHELLVDFRALDIDEDPQSVAQQRRRTSIGSILPRTPFTVPMLQPVGNDFVCCPRTSLAKFAKTGDWKILRESMAAEQEAAANASAVSAHVGPAGVLVGLAKHMETATKASRGRLIQHDGLRATGLINMGNTCFMNSALQCFVHSPVFREYFLSNRYEAEVNKKNHLGSRGAMAAAYAQLQSSLWRERDQGYLLPGRFRDEFTRVRRHFEETRQYDAHEFMVALLDCLHEDLNQGCRMIAASADDEIQDRSSRCLTFGSFNGGSELESVDGDEQADHNATDSSSDEVRGNAAWRDYTNVNSSVVVDLFHGQMRSETVCATCGERKCTFDPNLFFSLPIPESSFVRVEVSVLLQARKLPGGDDDENDPETALQAVQQGFWLRRGSNVGELCDRIAEVHGRAAGNRFLLVEVRRNRIKRIVEGDEVVDRLATAAPGSLSAYERAWTLAEIPVVPAIIREYFNDLNVADEAKTIAAEKVRSFSDLRVGSRVDARDNHNDWHSGTVIEVAGGGESEQVPRVSVHFDAFSSKWNKWFTARDWKAKRLQPLATRTSKSTEVFEVQVVHRFTSQASTTAASESGQTSGGDHSFTGNLPSSQKLSIASSHSSPSLNVFGTPLFVTIASDKTARDMHQALFLQIARFWTKFNGDPESTTDTSHKDLKQMKLPYEVRVVNLEDLTSERGESLPTESSALLQHFSTRSVLALDWFDVHDYSSCEERAPEDVPDEVVEAAKADPDLRADLDAAASSKKKTEPEEKAPVVDDDSPPMYAVPLTKCMDALMREEAISLEDHWVCEHCGVPREGRRLSAIWRLPDLVMVQLKRFQYLENQHKQKVRSLVDFPLKGLDFSKWMGHQDEGSSVYDLYAVANHVGGLTRGHYTAYCRYDADFPESLALFRTNEESGDVQCPELWFRFDDEKVSEIAAGDVVTDAAYVLFYKRRTLSPHNVLRYAL